MITPERCPTCHTFLDARLAGGLCPRCLLDHAAGDAPGGGVPEPAGLRERLAGALPGHELLECLGVGGMGAVYKARQRRLDRLVAVKVLLTPPAEAEGWDERFEREARALARLSHKNIIGVHDFGREGELSWLVLEYVEGANLRQLMEAGRLSPQEALAIVPQVCDALQYAHDEGVVHRDVKPENILMDLTGHVKIADFGLAKIVDRPASLLTLTGSQQAMGTLRYMAPEQLARPREVDHRADIYSLGVVIYEMLTGEVPAGRFEPPSQLRPGLDPRLDDLVLRALARQPEGRHASVSELRAELESLGTPARQPWIEFDEELAERARRRIRLARRGTALALAGAGGLARRGGRRVGRGLGRLRGIGLFTPLVCLVGFGLTCIEGARATNWNTAMIEGDALGPALAASFAVPLLALALAGWRESSARFQLGRMLGGVLALASVGLFGHDLQSLTRTGRAFVDVHMGLAGLLVAASVLHFLVALQRRLAEWPRPEGLHPALAQFALVASGIGFMSMPMHGAFGRDLAVTVEQADIRHTTRIVFMVAFTISAAMRASLREHGLVRFEGLFSVLLGITAFTAAAIQLVSMRPDLSPLVALIASVPLVLIGLFELVAGKGPDPGSPA